MAKAPVDLRSLARSHTEMALRTLCGIALNGENEAARVAASVHILDRGWGKAAQAHTGENGEGAISVVIRHIVEGASAPRVEPLPRDDAKVITLVPRKTEGDSE
jgi:hypothetical protein